MTANLIKEINQPSFAISQSFSQGNLPKINIQKQIKGQRQSQIQPWDSAKVKQNAIEKQNLRQVQFFETFNIAELQKHLRLVNAYENDHSFIGSKSIQKQQNQFKIYNDKKIGVLKPLNCNQIITKDKRTLSQSYEMSHQQHKKEKEVKIDHKEQQFNLECSLAERQSRISNLQKQIAKISKAVTQNHQINEHERSQKSFFTQNKASFISNSCKNNQRKQTSNNEILTESQLISFNSAQVSLNLTSQNMPTQVNDCSRISLKLCQKWQLFAEKTTLNNKAICYQKQYKNRNNLYFQKILLSQRTKNSELSKQSLQADQQIQFLKSLINKTMTLTAKLQKNIQKQNFQHRKLKTVSNKLMQQKAQLTQICQKQAKILQKMKDKWDSLAILIETPNKIITNQTLSKTNRQS